MFESDQEDDGGASSILSSKDSGAGTLGSNNSEGSTVGDDDGRYENSYRSVFHLQSHEDDMEEEDLKQYREVWLFRYLYNANGAAWFNVYFFTERSTLPRVARANDFL